jgi:hypothetical protein
MQGHHDMHRSLINMILAASLAVMAIGAPSAALACGGPEAASSECGHPDCAGGNPIARDCASACPTGCAAILTILSGKTVASDPPAAMFATGKRPIIPFKYDGPDPPPPRSR